MNHRPTLHAVRRAGFTIIELLVAVSVLSVVVGIVYESFSSVLDSTEMAREESEKTRFKQVLWRHLSENLGSVYSDAACISPEYQLLGTDKEGPFGPADTLRFCTSLTMPGSTALPGVLKVITYDLTNEYSNTEDATVGQVAIDKKPGDRDREYMLVIREEPLVLESAEKDSSITDVDFPVSERKIPIASMDILYYDGDQDEWLKDWDSLAEGRMPWAIQVNINFMRTEEELAMDSQSGINPLEEPDLNLTIGIPSGVGVIDQFMDLNMKRNTVEMEDSNGDLFGKGVQTGKTKTNKNKQSGASPRTRSSSDNRHSSSGSRHKGSDE